MLWGSRIQLDSHSLSFRALTALFGHYGIEWDLTKATESEINRLKEWIKIYKKHRTLISSGTLVRGEHAESSLWVTGVIDKAKTKAIYTLTSIQRAAISPRGRFLLPGLDETKTYHVQPIIPGEIPLGLQVPSWFNVEQENKTNGMQYYNQKYGAITKENKLNKE